MAANISREYNQYFRPTIVRVTREFQGIQNFIDAAEKVTVNTLAEYQRLFHVWAANADLLYGSTNNRSGCCSGPTGSNARARHSLQEAKEKLERLEATLSSEIAQLKKMDVGSSRRDPGSATQYKAVLNNAMNRLKIIMDSLGNSVRPARSSSTGLPGGEFAESSTTRRRQRTRSRQVND